MDLKVTKSAIERIKELAEKKALPAFYFRVGVRSGGCQGLSQYFEFALLKNEEDLQFDFDEIKVIVDPKSAVILNNAELDWKTSLIEKRFEINFPETKKHCGCGTSFSY